MASIQPRGSKFQLRLPVRGLKKPVFRTFPTLAAAEKYRDEILALQAKGFTPVELLERDAEARDRTLLGSAIGQYVKLSSTSPSDRELLGYLAAEVGHTRFDLMSYTWVEAYVKGLKVRHEPADGKLRKKATWNLAPGTIRKRVGALSRVWDWHQKRATGQASGNPFKLLPKGYSVYSPEEAAEAPAGAKQDIHRDIRLEPAVEARVREALAGVKRDGRERSLQVDPAFVLLLDLILDTGLRLSEAFKLRLDQVDLVGGYLRVESSKGRLGRRKMRTVPLKKTLREKLKVWCGGRAPGLVFPFWSGEPEDVKRCSGRLSARFASLFEYAGAPDFTEHDLRHEACCRWVELRRPGGGWVFSETEIAKIMGWSTMDMMLRYASLRGEDLASRLE